MPNELNIVLDIDEVLANDFGDYEDQYPEIKKICSNPGRYIIAIRPHFIHHGVFEFLKALLNIDNVKLYFFSADRENRNIPFVRELFERINPNGFFEKTNQQKRIFSRKDTTDAKDNKEIQPDNSLYFGSRKKDLRKIAQNENDLKNTVIADDNLGNVCRGQEKNYIFILPVQPNHLIQIYKETKLTSHELKISENFKTLNHIFYLAGLLLPAIHKANKTNSSLAEMMNQVQFYLNMPKYSLLQDDIQIYETGLNILKQYNASIEFLLPNNLTSQLDITDEIASYFLKKSFSTQLQEQWSLTPYRFETNIYFRKEELEIFTSYQLPNVLTDPIIHGINRHGLSFNKKIEESTISVIAVGQKGEVPSAILTALVCQKSFFINYLKTYSLFSDENSEKPACLNNAI